MLLSEHVNHMHVSSVLRIAADSRARFCTRFPFLPLSCPHTRSMFYRQSLWLQAADHKLDRLGYGFLFRTLAGLAKIRWFRELNFYKHSRLMPTHSWLARQS